MYFVYRHIRLDKNEPFYIGMGKSRHRNDTYREFYGRAYSKKRSKYWENIVSKTDYKIDIIFESDNRQDVIDKEIEFISLYGFKYEGGYLCNLTHGGEYTVLSEERRKDISIHMMGNKNGLGRKISEQQKQAVSERFKGNKTWLGKKHKEESKLKISIGMIGKKNSKGVYNVKPNCKRILCNNTGIEYNSICECVRLKFGSTEISAHNSFRCIKNSIIKVLKGKTESYKGFKFSYL